ncbi:MAG: hypothetical protein KC561_01585 [Myxococcales bacterium]|nr:hypothetical protein [Myxococcales bacterium]
MSNPDLGQLADSYLDGDLSAEQARWFEHNLLRPEVADAFRSALVLRELLQGQGPDELPAGLLERLEACVLAELDESLAEGLMGRARAVLSTLGLAWRGASLAYSGGPKGGRETVSGIATIRYSLGPLAPNTGAEEAPTPKKKPLWRRLLTRKRSG